MDLWIKTQKNDLFKVNNVQVLGCDIYAYINDGNYTLGEYDSGDRALEVIREIQNLLMSQDKLLISIEVPDYKYGESIYNHIKDKGWLIVDDNKNEPVKYITPNTIVYEMPKE